MKKAIKSLDAGTPFKYKGGIYIGDDSGDVICLTDGAIIDVFYDGLFEEKYNTIVTVCKRIRKVDIKERK